MRRKTYLDVELSRERRLWFKEITKTGTRLAFIGAIIFSDKEVREGTKKALKKASDKVKSIFS